MPGLPGLGNWIGRIGLATRRLFGAPSGPWTPATLGAGLKLSLDPQNTASITETAGAVSAWQDTAGAGTRIFTQATGADQPTYGATSYYSRAGVTGDGVSDVMTWTGDPGLNQPHDIWLLYNQTRAAASVSTDHILSYGNGQGGGSVVVRRTVVSGVNRCQVSVANNGGGTTVTNATEDFSGLCLVRVKVRATSCEVEINQVGMTPTTLTSLSISNTRFRLFASAATTPVNFAEGVIGGLWITDPLSGVNESNMYAYANARKTWRPQVLGAQLYLMVDVADTASLDSLAPLNGVVSSIYDTAGPGTRQFTQPSSSLKFAYAAAGLAGKPSMNADGTDDYMGWEGDPAFPTEHDVWVVVDQQRLAAVASTDRILSYGNAASRSVEVRRGVISGVNRASLAVGNGTTTLTSTNTTEDFTGPVLIRGKIRAASGEMEVNQIAGTPVAVVPMVGATRFRIAASAGNTPVAFPLCAIAGIWVTSVLSGADETNMYTYLNARKTP